MDAWVERAASSDGASIDVQSSLEPPQVAELTQDGAEVRRIL